MTPLIWRSLFIIRKMMPNPAQPRTGTGTTCTCTCAGVRSVFRAPVWQGAIYDKQQAGHQPSVPASAASRASGLRLRPPAWRALAGSGAPAVLLRGIKRPNMCGLLIYMPRRLAPPLPFSSFLFLLLFSSRSHSSALALVAPSWCPPPAPGKPARTGKWCLYYVLRQVGAR